MSAKDFIKLSYGGLGVYLLLAAFFGFTGDGDRFLMFLIGSVLWIICAAIWRRIDQQENQ